MPAMHSYVVKDTDAFLADDQKRVKLVINMINKVLNAATTDCESHKAKFCAAKLLEIIILECRSKIDHALPSYLKIVFKRLRDGLSCGILLNLCLQVINAALWCNKDLCLRTLDKAKKKGRSMFVEFLEMLSQDITIEAFLGYIN